MGAKPLTVTARVKAGPGKEEEVLGHLLSLIEPSRKDPGCLNYDLHRSQTDPGSFLFHENWARRDLWDRHMAKPDLQAIISRLAPLLAEPPEITCWDKIG